MIDYLTINGGLQCDQENGLCVMHGPFSVSTICRGVSVDKPFKNIEEQVLILKSRNLIFENEEKAKESLLTYGYYEIINGYKEPFIDHLSNCEDEVYRDGAKFESILQLFEFDKSLGHLILRYLLHIEVKLRTSIGYVVAKNIGHVESEYLDRRKYRSGYKYKHKQGYQIDSLIAKFKKITNDTVEPFIHYREAYGNIPPWIMLKNTSFGNLIDFLKLQKADNKKEIIALFLNKEVSDITQDTIITTIELLLVSKSFRNKCAHNGRVYNYTPLNNNRKFVVLGYNKDFFEYNNISYEDYKSKYKYRSNLYLVFCGIKWIDRELYEKFENTFIHLVVQAGVCSKWIISEIGLPHNTYREMQTNVLERMKRNIGF